MIPLIITAVMFLVVLFTAKKMIASEDIDVAEAGVFVLMFAGTFSFIAFAISLTVALIRGVPDSSQ